MATGFRTPDRSPHPPSSISFRFRATFCLANVLSLQVCSADVFGDRLRCAIVALKRKKSSCRLCAQESPRRCGPSSNPMHRRRRSGSEGIHASARARHAAAPNLPPQRIRDDLGRLLTEIDTLTFEKRDQLAHAESSAGRSQGVEKQIPKRQASNGAGGPVEVPIVFVPRPAWPAIAHTRASQRGMTVVVRYLPCQFGARFSANAVAPSMPSSLLKTVS